MVVDFGGDLSGMWMEIGEEVAVLEGGGYERQQEKSLGRHHCTCYLSNMAMLIQSQEGH